MRKVWKLWLLAGACFLLAGIISILTDKKYFLGSMDILLGGFYFVLSIVHYNKENKSEPIKISNVNLGDIDAELRELIIEGKKIKAIKRCRVVTGLGLKEAKEYVDNLEYKVNKIKC